MNLADISIESTFGSLVGYAERDIQQYLSEHVKQVAEKRSQKTETMFDEMRDWYNGYRFSAESELVYNPWSILRYLQTHQFKNYWFESGTPTFAIKSLKKTQGIIQTSFWYSLSTSL